MKTILAVLVLLVYGNRAGKAEAYRDQEHVNNNKVFVITLDGFRWQELFGGADPALLRPLTGTNSAGSGWLHPDPEQRREQLMPFMWRMVAAKGLLIGNRKKGSRLNVANPYALSYAGYNELFTGKPDYAIWRNERVVNRNRTILEYLNGLPSLKGKIGSIGSWSLFPYIFNKQRSHIYLDAAGTEGAVRHDSRQRSS